MPVSNDTQTLTIVSGGTASTSYRANNMAAYGLQMPAAFTGTSISFKVSADGATFQALYEVDDPATGTQRQVTLAVTASRNYALPDALTPWKAFMIVSNGVEGADRSLVVVGKAP